MSEVEGNWDIVITNLQDICNVNASLSIDDKYNSYSRSKLEGLSHDQLEKIKQEMIDHQSNLGTAKRLIETSQQNLQVIIDNLQKKDVKPVPVRYTSKRLEGKTGKNTGVNKKFGNRKVGRSFYTSKYNPSEPILIGSEVAYKLKNRHSEEWIQCEVMKVTHDGTKYEIRDPEPDENNNPGQTFKATYKEILLIPPISEVKDLPDYPYNAKVLARYPETTTFYTANVIGHKREGFVRLIFDGEEEVNKETDIERRLVLPLPAR